MTMPNALKTTNKI